MPMLWFVASAKVESLVSYKKDTFEDLRLAIIVYKCDITYRPTKPCKTQATSPSMQDPRHSHQLQHPLLV